MRSIDGQVKPSKYKAKNKEEVVEIFCGMIGSNDIYNKFIKQWVLVQEYLVDGLGKEEGGKALARLKKYYKLYEEFQETTKI